MAKPKVDKKTVTNRAEQQQPECEVFKAWLGRNTRVDGVLWTGRAKHNDLCGWRLGDNAMFLANLYGGLCRIADRLLSHVAPGKRRRVEITVRFL